MVTIDILLAAYQGQRWLNEQLRSLQHQAWDDFRVLMQDDGSTDDTRRLLEAIQHEDARFCLTDSQTRHGCAAANFLSLIKQSDAPYCALCDQDDRWVPDRLWRGMQVIQEAEQRYGKETPLLVHSDCCVTDEAGQVLHTSLFRHQGWSMDALTLPRLLVQNNVTGCTVLMNAALRELVAKHAKPEQVLLHDWFLALTAAAFGHILFIDVPLVHYRQHDGNTIGASADGQLSRAVHALMTAEKARQRIELTYRNAGLLRDCYGDELPEAARRIIDRYLEIQTMPKLRRILALCCGGYTMQSAVTLAGQLFFG